MSFPSDFEDDNPDWSGIEQIFGPPLPAEALQPGAYFRKLAEVTIKSLRNPNVTYGILVRAHNSMQAMISDQARLVAERDQRVASDRHQDDRARCDEDLIFEILDLSQALRELPELPILETFCQAIGQPFSLQSLEQVVAAAAAPRGLTLPACRSLTLTELVRLLQGADGPGSGDPPPTQEADTTNVEAEVPYLGIQIDSNARTVRREGYETTIDLSNSAMLWELLVLLLQRRGEPALANDRRALTGEASGHKRLANRLRDKLIPIGLSVESYALTSSGMGNSDVPCR